MQENNFNWMDVNSLPVGYRFVPTNEELIICYLKKNVNGEQLPPNKIINANIYQDHPEILTRKYEAATEKTWYFFTPRARMSENATRPKRSTADNYGTWKASTGEKTIKYNGVEVGFVMNLVFFEGKNPPIKTDWLMNEYTLRDSGPKRKLLENEVVLCKIYKKNGADGDLNNGRQELQHEMENGDDNNVVRNHDDQMPAGVNINPHESADYTLPQPHESMRGVISNYQFQQAVINPHHQPLTNNVNPPPPPLDQTATAVPPHDQYSMGVANYLQFQLNRQYQPGS